MLNEQLIQLQKGNDYAAVYANCASPEKFLFGRVIFCGEDHFVIESFCPDGGEDGWILKEYASVFRVEIDSQYVRKMQSLMLLDRSLEKPELNSDCLIDSLLLFAKKMGFLVGIEVLENGCEITGWVKSLQDGICCIQQLDEYGNEDGESFIDVLDITQIGCHTSDEQQLEHLAKLKFRPNGEGVLQ
jgi:hypothetical protein